MARLRIHLACIPGPPSRGTPASMDRAGVLAAKWGTGGAKSRGSRRGRAPCLDQRGRLSSAAGPAARASAAAALHRDGGEAIGHADVARDGGGEDGGMSGRGRGPDD
eukprot:7804209-Pyramimonas_sp.AAC.1